MLWILIAFLVFCPPSIVAGDKADKHNKSTKETKIHKDKNLDKTQPTKLSKQKKSSTTSHPDKFKVKYNLKDAAEIAVNILDANYFPVKTFIVTGTDTKKAKLGTKKGQNEFSLWDGKDIYGNEAPPGEYYACISVVYPDGKKETIGFKFVKE